MSEPISTSGGMTGEQVKAVEAQLGRALSQTERALGELDRPAPQDARERIAEKHWRVPMKPEPKRDEALAQAEAAVEAEHRAGLKKAERVLYDMKKSRAEAQAKVDADDKHKAYLETPKIKAAIDEVTAAIEASRWDPEVSRAEMLALKRTLQTLTTPNSDEAAAFKMLGEIRNANLLKREEKRKALSDKLAAMGVEREAIEAKLAALDPKQEPGTSPKWQGPKPSFEECDALWSKYTALDRSSPEGEAALAEWNEAVEAFGGLAAVQAAEAASKAKG